jgi:hypothetical protein
LDGNSNGGEEAAKVRLVTLWADSSAGSTSGLGGSNAGTCQFDNPLTAFIAGAAVVGAPGTRVSTNNAAIVKLKAFVRVNIFCLLLVLVKDYLG